MRYYIIFGITIIISLFIMFYNPYLGVYKDSFTINYESLKIDDSTYEEKTSYQQTSKILLKTYPEVKVRASIDKI